MFYLIALIGSMFFYFTDSPLMFYTSSVFVFAIGLLVQLCSYYNHNDNIETIKREKEDIKVYEEQTEDILNDVKLYLIDKFPDHEMKIFDKISSNTANILSIKYPEIKSDECIKQALSKIIIYKDNIYTCKRKINELKKSMSVRKKNMILTCLPILPKDNLN